MSKKIFRSILFTASVVLLTSLVVVMASLYGYFTEQQGVQLGQELRMAAQGVELGGTAYLEGLRGEDYRLTWVDQSGGVLYDTHAPAEGMENHAQREEVREALATGEGAASRMSATLMRRTIYQARRLSDGTVLRVSADQVTALALLLWMSQAILLLVVIAAVVSYVLADKLARQVVKPINALNLDDPLSNDVYEELSPLLRRVHQQKGQLAAQMKALRERSDELAQITANMGEGMVLLNDKGTILHLNPAAQAIFCGHDGWEGRALWELDRSPELSRALQAALEAGHGELHQTRNGREYLLSISRIVSGGQVIGAVLLTFDVTEKAAAERSRREFTANVSHELKTPLQSIIGSAELLEQGMVEPSDAPRFAGRIRAEAQRLVSLIEDILRLSQLDEGADMAAEEVELLALCEEVRAALEGAAAAKSVTITVDGGEARVSGVRPLLYEMVYNLCDNAIKYNVEGGAVTLAVSRDDRGTALTVSDTGIGIPPEDQGRVFERFYRVDKSRSKAVGGTGLGLAIVKHTAQLHGAALRLDSQPGQGARVTVLFPQLEKQP